MEDTDPIDDMLELYHYGVFVPMERLRFSLGCIFYPVIRFLVDWLMCLLEGRAMKLVGWIKAKKDDEVLLRGTFNVKGKMIYRNGCFEYCELGSVEAIEKLQRELPGFYADAFTAVDDLGNSLPRDRQPFGYHDGKTTTTGVS